MTATVLVAGTASHVGKSTVVAGLCRLLADRGVAVTPFKAQNMSNNARVAVTPDGGWGEIGVSQFVQARAARIPPTTDMNPVLLKPRGGGESQLVVEGQAVGHFGTAGYYRGPWDVAREAAVAAFERLAASYDVVVAEGAGGIGEINLHDRDLANVETATFADASVLVLADIERGGAFASLYGSLELAPPAVRDRVVGAAITKFRGDRDLLSTGIDAIEDRTGVPVVGVLPYDDPGLPAEDSVTIPEGDGVSVFGDDGLLDARTVTVVVPRLPHISNFTDLEPLARTPGVRVAFVPPDDPLDGADAVVLPGTKNTVDDLLALRAAGFENALRAFDGPVVGLCGGYQMLGERLTNTGVESPSVRGDVDGFGLLPVATRFSRDKRVVPATRELDGTGPLAGASGPVAGYEIHTGETRPTGPVETPLGGESAAVGNVLGTYLHGLFENRIATEAFAAAAARHAGTTLPDRGGDGPSACDRAADLVDRHLDLSTLGLGGVA